MSLAEDRHVRPVQRERGIAKLRPVPRQPKQPGLGPGCARKRKNPTVFELTTNACRRPLWDRYETDVFQKFYCGKPALKPLGYCAECADLIYDDNEALD